MGVLEDFRSFATRNTDEVISGTSVRKDSAGQSVDTLADIVTGDDPNDDIDLGQWVNKTVPGTPLAAAEEFGGPREPETWEEDPSNPWDVTQEQSENTIEEWTDNVSRDVTGLDFGTLRPLILAGLALFLLAPLLEIGANLTE